MIRMAPLKQDVRPELGHPGGLRQAWDPTLAGGWVSCAYEDTPELEFPLSAAVYDRMRRSDGQVGALLRAFVMPILAADWKLDGDGCRPEVVDAVRVELGLETPGKGRARRRSMGIRWTEHARLALLSVPFGFMAFERLYEIGPPLPGQEAAGVAQMAHIRKLAPRLPRTIREIRVDRDGGLAGIVQVAPGLDAAQTGDGAVIIGDRAGQTGTQDYEDKLIEADRLVMYSLEKEGADWTGTSVLRTSYKHWLLKDFLIRSGAQAVERNGMGVPVVTFNAEHTREDAMQLVKDFRAGANAGAAIPEGMKLELLGTTGSTKDELPLVQYHDQAMSRSVLAMFLDLGHDNGARALGETFVDYFVMSLRSVADWLGEVTTDEVIADFVRVNFGADEPYPALVCAPIHSKTAATAAALKTLVEARILTPDNVLEDEVRGRYDLPATTGLGQIDRETTMDPDPAPDDDAAADPQVDQTNPDNPDNLRAPHDIEVLARAEAVVRRIADLTKARDGAGRV